MDGAQVATSTVKQSRLKEALREAMKNNYVKTAILILIVIGGVVSFWFGIKAVLRTEYPFMAVATPSMVPTLPVGTLIVVQGYSDPSTIYTAPKNANPPGDIVVFLNYNQFEGIRQIVHRAVGETTVNGKRYLITLGDANSGITDNHCNITTHDRLPGLPEEYVIGKVVFNVQYIGGVALFMQTPSGRIIVIALVIVLLIVEFIPFSKLRKNKEQVEA